MNDELFRDSYGSLCVVIFRIPRCGCNSIVCAGNCNVADSTYDARQIERTKLEAICKGKWIWFMAYVHSLQYFSSCYSFLCLFMEFFNVGSKGWSHEYAKDEPLRQMVSFLSRPFSLWELFLLRIKIAREIRGRKWVWHPFGRVWVALHYWKQENLLFNHASKVWVKRNLSWDKLCLTSHGAGWWTC